MNAGAEQQPDVPTRNGPTCWARRPPSEPKITSGRANSVMPRLAIHSLVSRSSSTTAHSASNAPIIIHTAQPRATAPANGRMRSRSKAAAACGGSTVSSTRALRATNGRATSVAAAMTRNGPGMPNGPTSSGRHGRSGGEAADVDGEQAAEVVADPLRLGDDDDAPDRRHGHADTDAHHEPARRSSGTKSRGRGHQQEADDVERHAAEHEVAGVAAVGERGDAGPGRGTRRRSRSPITAPSADSPMPYSSRMSSSMLNSAP